ncbi:hypothetical protein COSO111634_31800 [Corallococcus soli]
MTRFTRPSSSRKVGSPPSRVRSTSVLTKKPMSPSVSLRVRPAMGAPTLTSSCSAQRESTAWKPASRPMNSVAPSCWHSAVRSCASFLGKRSWKLEPGCREPGDRGRSVGSASDAGAPASWFRQ